MSGGISREKRTVDYSRMTIEWERMGLRGIWYWDKYKESRCRTSQGEVEGGSLSMLVYKHGKNRWVLVYR